MQTETQTLTKNPNKSIVSPWSSAKSLIQPINSLILFLFRGVSNGSQREIVIFGSFGYLLAEIFSFNTNILKAKKYRLNKLFSDIDIKISNSLENTVHCNIVKFETLINKLRSPNKLLTDYVEYNINKSSFDKDLLAIGNIKSIICIKFKLNAILKLFENNFKYSHFIYSFKNVLDFFEDGNLNIDISVDYTNYIDMSYIRPISLGRFGMKINIHHFDGLNKDNICILGTTNLKFNNSIIMESMRDYKLFVNSIRRNIRRNNGYLQKITCSSIKPNDNISSEYYSLLCGLPNINEDISKNANILMQNLIVNSFTNDSEISFIDSYYIPYVFNLNKLIELFLIYNQKLDLSYCDSVKKILQFAKINLNYDCKDSNISYCNCFKNIGLINKHISNNVCELVCPICAEEIDKDKLISLICFKNCHFLCFDCATIYWNSGINDITSSLTEYYLSNKLNNMKLKDICTSHTGRELCICPICRDSSLPDICVDRSMISVKTKIHSFSVSNTVEDYLKCLGIDTITNGNINRIKETPLLNTNFLPRFWTLKSTGANMFLNNILNNSNTFNIFNFLKVFYLDQYKLYKNYIRKIIKAYKALKFRMAINLLIFTRLKQKYVYANKIIKAFRLFRFKKNIKNKIILRKTYILFSKIIFYHNKKRKNCIRCNIFDKEMNKLNLCQKCLIFLNKNKDSYTLVIPIYDILNELK